MNELSNKLKTALNAIAKASQHLTPDEQDEVATAIFDLACTRVLPAEVVKPLIAEADAAIARGDAHPWDRVRDELRAKLSTAPH